MKTTPFVRAFWGDYAKGFYNKNEKNKLLRMDASVCDKAFVCAIAFGWHSRDMHSGGWLRFEARNQKRCATATPVFCMQSTAIDPRAGTDYKTRTLIRKQHQSLSRHSGEIFSIQLVKMSPRNSVFVQILMFAVAFNVICVSHQEFAFKGSSFGGVVHNIDRELTLNLLWQIMFATRRMTST